MQRSGITWRVANMREEEGSGAERGIGLILAWVVDEHEPSVGAALWIAKQ